jgi:hypothetical protein
MIDDTATLTEPMTGIMGGVDRGFFRGCSEIVPNFRGLGKKSRGLDIGRGRGDVAILVARLRRFMAYTEWATGSASSDAKTRTEV